MTCIVCGGGIDGRYYCTLNDLTVSVCARCFENASCSSTEAIDRLLDHPSFIV